MNIKTSINHALTIKVTKGMTSQGSTIESKNNTHKLLIALSYDPSVKSTYSDFLNDSEFPRGVYVNFDLYITNLGELDFPGGMVEELSLAFGISGVGPAITSFPSRTDINTLRHNEQKLVYEWQSYMYCEGIFRIQCRISSNDGKPIEYFKSKDDESGKSTSNWNIALSVVNREQLEIAKTLRSIDRKIQ